VGNDPRVLMILRKLMCRDSTALVVRIMATGAVPGVSTGERLRNSCSTARGGRHSFRGSPENLLVRSRVRGVLGCRSRGHP
jgi:hypothetical protein